MATVAQLVEHLVVVLVVAGSSPVGRPILLYLSTATFLCIHSISLAFERAALAFLCSAILKILDAKNFKIYLVLQI